MAWVSPICASASPPCTDSIRASPWRHIRRVESVRPSRSLGPHAMQPKNVTAVIAEDEPILRAQLRTRLAQAWPELEIVAEAENGEQAIALCSRLEPDIAF